MNPPFRRATGSSLIGCAPWLLAIVSGFASSGVVAQQNEASASSRQPSTWFEPRISVQHTVTNNARLNDTKISDQVTEVTPGVRWIGNTARIKGFFDYSLTSIQETHDLGEGGQRCPRQYADQRSPSRDDKRSQSAERQRYRRIG